MDGLGIQKAGDLFEVYLIDLISGFIIYLQTCNRSGMMGSLYHPLSVLGCDCSQFIKFISNGLHPLLQGYG